MRYFLGVDVGGTKTHALVADEHGHAIGFAEAGPGNPQGVGYEGLRRAIEAAVRAALRQAGANGEAGLRGVAGAGFGIGGYDWPSQLKAHMDAITPLGLTCPVDVTNDSIIGLMAGTSRGWGVVLIAGTGNNCRGRDRAGHEARITGEGGRFGEYGGAGEMVERAVQAIAHEWTGRGPRTALTQRFIEIAGAKDLDALIEGIDLNCYQPDASWAPVIFAAARAGDEVAREIITWSACESGESACAVIRRLGIQDEEFDVILAGSVFAGGALYIEPLEHTVHRTAPRAKLLRLEAPPVVGGVVLGMQKAGLETAAIHAQLIESTKRLIARP